MLFYEVNAQTIYNIAHDATKTKEERVLLIANMLKLMDCGGKIDGNNSQK